MRPRHRVKVVGGGAKSWRFPRTWRASGYYHQPGQEMLGENIQTGEVVITIDDILVSPVALSDIDEMLSHFDERSHFSTEMGRALARIYDQNVMRQMILTARAPADGPFPGGDVITDASLAPDVNGVYDGLAWIEAIRENNRTKFKKNIPDEIPRYMTVNPDIFDALKYAKDANGNYLVLSRDFSDQPAGGVGTMLPETIRIDGTEIIRSNLIPSVDDTANADVYTKYRGNFAATEAIAWCPDAVATVQMMDIGMESARDTRRLEDFMVAKALVGHGTLRAECATEFASA